MAYHPRWVPRYREYYGPQYFDNVYRRWDSAIKVKHITLRSQDPLHFDHDLEHCNGGIALILELMHDKGTYHIPLKHKAFILYNMSKKRIYDPSVYENFEKQYKTSSSVHMNCRIAFGAVYAYY